jgi:hypothetical protein
MDTFFIFKPGATMDVACNLIPSFSNLYSLFILTPGFKLNSRYAASVMVCFISMNMTPGAELASFQADPQILDLPPKDQITAFRIINTLVAVLSSGDFSASAPVRCTILGQAGTGKAVLVQTVISVVRRMFRDRYLCCSMSPHHLQGLTGSAQGIFLAPGVPSSKTVCVSSGIIAPCQPLTLRRALSFLHQVQKSTTMTDAQHNSDQERLAKLLNNDDTPPDAPAASKLDAVAAKKVTPVKKGRFYCIEMKDGSYNEIDGHLAASSFEDVYGDIIDDKRNWTTKHGRKYYVDKRPK